MPRDPARSVPVSPPFAAAPASRREFLAVGALFGLAGVARPAEDVFVDEFAAMWQRTGEYTIEVADTMPADGWSFRPVPEVRSFAEQQMHIASTIYGFSGIIGGQRIADAPDFGPDRPKPELMRVLRRSIDVPVPILRALPPGGLDETVAWQRRIGGASDHPKRGIALTLWHHTAHHRAQCIVYLRMRGIEPPGYVD